jgi:hypothetical protein
MSDTAGEVSLPQATPAGVARGQIPLWLKLLYTAFMAVLVPVYWYYYGPTNFLYFCDVALILTLIGIWRENALLISMCAAGIVLPQTVWVIDFVGQTFGVSLLGMTAYMFQDTSLFLRGLSLFHGWIPFLLVYLVSRLGYDRRGFLAWTAVASTLILICYFFMPPPNPNPGLTPVNINYVWGPSDYAAQTWVSPTVWVIGLLIGMPLLLYAPVHLVLARVMPKAPRQGATA